ncbi:MAG: hypothetical protein R3258_00650 [Acidimicrobiia bacterium]|nr:hypothetical protein [Acidimicrobiia bacterium]
MYRLAELTDSRRKLIGATLLVLGLVGLALAVFWIHWSSYPETELVDGVAVPYVVDHFNWFPRGALWKGIGYLIAGGAATFAMIGAAFLWVLNQKMTWARATIAAMIAWFALVFFFGIVPSEWLNFAQTDLEWGNDPAITIPPFLVLGNEVSLSWAAIKDSISMGYHLVMLGVAGALAIGIQKMKDGRPAHKQPDALTSPYGRPLVKGER